jgi:hypothetical protein
MRNILGSENIQMMFYGKQLANQHRATFAHYSSWILKSLGSPVGSAEGIVDVHVERGGELLGKLLVVLLLLSVEADILKEANLTENRHR